VSGTFFVVGVGPGDPELLTLKAARVIGAAPVVAWFAKAGRAGHAHRTACGMIAPAAERLAFDYPFTTEIDAGSEHYRTEMAAFYDVCAGHCAQRLESGRDIALLCEGDPFFYGSAMYLFDRLGPRFPTDIVPGITGMSGCWSRAMLPMAHGDDTFIVLPGTLDEDTLSRRLLGDHAAVVMKLGRNMPKVRAALDRAGRADRAVCVVQGTMAGERIMPLCEVNGAEIPYFAMVLVPGRAASR
jgi:precorrin-2/cobalt-factor-2 C20-methyltransferase